MSLNGLDNPTVIEAYQIALTEAGGWFLLRYVSRDEVTLHERGTGGVPDVRNAIESYEECSPLYGFLQYRRRKVVLSYLPEDLSRLVRARTTVQFQSVLDKFSPHDTVFSLSQPSGLTESALSSACLLHTASGSIASSSSSLRRRRLMEIAEDTEETPTSKDTVQVQGPTEDARQRSFSQASEATVVPPSVASNAPHTPNGDVPAPISLDQVQVNGQTPSISGDHHSERPTSSRNFRDDLSYAESRMSTQSARPTLRDLDHPAGYKPKVKLGPRPSVDESGRPRTAGNLTRSAEQRPVASLPAGVRVSPFRKSNPPPARPRSQGNLVATPSVKMPPVPPLLVPPPSMPISRPQLSPGAKSLSALSTSTTSNEKERLMKALQLRKSQMHKRAQAQQVKQTQVSSEEQRNAAQDLIDNEKNIGQPPEKVKYDKERQRLSSISEHDKGPLSEPEVKPQLPATPDSVPVHNQQEMASFEPSNAEQTADMADDYDQSDYILPSTTYSAPASELTSLNKSAKEEQMTLSEPETERRNVNIGSTRSEIKCGTGSPSAVINVPPEDNLKNSPEEIVAIISQAEGPPIPHENEVVAVTKPTEFIDPHSDPLPRSPVSESKLESVAESSATTASHSTEQPNAPSSEVVNVEQQSTTTRKEKRKPILEPIQVLTPDYSDDDNLLSDDSFMEELKSATVEEAKPISVGKSPLSPGYSNSGNTQAMSDAWRNSRAVSNPSAVGHQYPNIPTLSVGRSISSPFTQVENSTGPVLVAKKINVSSGISKRIKALEQFSSSRDAPATTTQSVSTPTAASFEALRKRASVSHGGGNSGMLSRHPSYAPEPFSRASSIKRRDSTASINATRTTNSVSVTARIIRDPSTVGSDLNTDPAELRALSLQAYPLTVERDTPEESSSRNLTPESTPKTELRSMSISSASSVPQPPTALLPRSESRLSVSSKNEGYFLSRSPSETSASSPEEKKESRTSRLLRRMSSITSSSRRSTISSRSPAVKESDSMPPVAKGSKNTVELPAAIDIGEVNVQFPDTLLWKRRFIRIDSKGYLVLTPGNIDSSNRNMVKRYHLTEFRTPCLPDEERQELPNSILLDFLDGSTLQCACESRQGQASVLQTLVNAHSIHQQLLSN